MARPPTGTVFVICGPTASGKSGLALALAQRLAQDGAGGTVINADSMQVYRGLEILTAQPEAAARAAAPHLLYGILDPADSCSAGRWRGLAVEAIGKVLAEGGVPVLAGGTGLYLRALIDGIAPVPMIPSAVRDRLRARCAAIGPAALHAELAARDPEGAAAIRPTDPLRLMRALEVIEATGRPLAYWRAQPVEGPPPDWRFCRIRLDPPRAALYATIEARFDAMLAAGALEEVRALAARGLDPAVPALKALGVSELARAAAGDIEIEYAVIQAKTRSRNYAKRQVTWFNRQMITDFSYCEKLSERLCDKILSEIL